MAPVVHVAMSFTTNLITAPMHANALHLEWGVLKKIEIKYGQHLST